MKVKQGLKELRDNKKYHNFHLKIRRQSEFYKFRFSHRSCQNRKTYNRNFPKRIVRKF